MTSYERSYNSPRDGEIITIIGPLPEGYDINGKSKPNIVDDLLIAFKGSIKQVLKTIDLSMHSVEGDKGYKYVNARLNLMKRRGIFPYVRKGKVPQLHEFPTQKELESMEEEQKRDRMMDELMSRS